MSKEQEAKFRIGVDYDICECGDYRHQHEDGVGRCRMPDDGCHGFKPCLRFRLSEEAPKSIQALKKLLRSGR